MKQIVQRAESHWLSLRRPADHAARRPTLTAVGRLSQHLSCGLGDGQSASVLDLGAGTGSNLEWLGPRLDVAQAWTLIDRDEDLLRLAIASPSARVVTVQRIAAELDNLVPAHRPDGAHTLVTCSAVLDVLTMGQVESLCRLVADMGASALFSLTVTGEVVITPGHALDERIGDTFNAHQERHGLSGSRATAVARRVLAAAGFDVEVIATPWGLGRHDSPLARRYLTERVASVVEQDPRGAEPYRDWLEVRLRQVGEGTLRVTVGHEDLVAIRHSH